MVHHQARSLLRWQTATCPLPAQWRLDQGIILEFPTLVELPPFPIAHPTHESAGFPPVGRRRFPDDSYYAEQALAQLLCLASTSTSPEFGQNDSGVPDDESPADLGEQVIVQTRLPVSDVDTRIQDGPVQS